MIQLGIDDYIIIGSAVLIVMLIIFFYWLFTRKRRSLQNQAPNVDGGKAEVSPFYQPPSSPQPMVYADHPKPVVRPQIKTYTRDQLPPNARIIEDKPKPQFETYTDEDWEELQNDN